MTIELVDGHGGKPHISGEDLGDFKAGILGDAGYVFKRANMLAATLNGSNSITIATGSGIMPASGRHFRVTAPETLTITSGTQGQNRNDLIVVRATTDEGSTTVETATLVVLRGTPTSGTATDPATQDGDLPLYRLQLTGVSVAEPIALFDVMVPYSEFRDSISPVTVDSWETIKIGSTLVATIRTEITTAINTKEGNIYISNIVNIPLPSGFNISNTVAVASIVGTTWRWCNAFIREDNPDSLSVRLFSGTSQSSESYAVGVVLIGQV